MGLHDAIQENYTRVFEYFPDHHWAVLIVATFFVHQMVYYSVYIPYAIIDSYPSMRQKYKIQPKKENTMSLQWRCIKLLLANNFLSQLPMILFLPLAFKFTRMSYTDPVPALTTIAWQIPFCMVVEDTWHYWAHRGLHSSGWVYRTIHKVHHEHTAPFAITAEYATHVETMVLGVGTMLGPFLLQAHYFCILLWMGVRVIQALDAHSGYDLPWSPHNWIPFYGGSLYHDFHHSNIVGNYSSSFIWWDIIMGTDQAFKRSQAKKGSRAVGGAKHADDWKISQLDQSKPE